MRVQVHSGAPSDESWRKEIENKLILNFDVDAVKAALSEWSDFSGILDREYLRFLEFNFSDIPVAILTNGTTRLRKDLANLNFDTQIYKIFNSAEIGVCKPNNEIYIHVTENLRASPSEILFIDDSIAHVNAAKVLGFQVYHYTTLEAFIDKFKTEAISKKL